MKRTKPTKRPLQLTKTVVRDLGRDLMNQVAGAGGLTFNAHCDSGLDPKDSACLC
jgi:hypothetical protein